jgi:superfamily I DNA/RNA helicase
MRSKSGTPKSSVTIGDAGTVLTPRARAARRTSSILDVVLDPAQRAAVEQPAGNALLILGEAGHGKTTVAIHRLAHLWKASSTPLRAAVIVPTEGLAGSLQPMLRQLGVDLEVMTYDRWASLQARRAFRRPPRESESTPPSVVRLKRHPELRSAIAEVANRAPGRIDNDVDIAAPPTTALATRGDLQQLFGDAVLLERVARAARLPPRDLNDTLDRTRTQFSPRAEEEWARHLLRRDRRASIAMVCRSPRTARRITERLHAAEIPARLVFDGRFFARGVVQVTTVEEVKGLEFDFVIIPDAGVHDYPNDSAARRAMYVAVTRARHQVAVACVGEASRLGGGYL